MPVPSQEIGRDVAGRASGIKTVGMAEVGAPISKYRWVASIQIVGASALLSSLWPEKKQKMVSNDMIIGRHMGAPTCLPKQEMRKPS